MELILLGEPKTPCSSLCSSDVSCGIVLCPLDGFVCGNDPIIACDEILDIV